MVEKGEDGDQEQPLLLWQVVISMDSNVYILILWTFMRNLLKEAAKKRYQSSNKAFEF